MTGGEALIESLKKEGVDVLFGYPGGVVIPIFDVLYNTKGIDLILTRHEQGAVHAAEGYARSSGKVGVALVTSGPGATNTITGIADAKLDSVPLVVISGQVRSSIIGTDAFQEADVLGITRSICKHNYLVRDVKDVPRVIKEAFYIARTGRPGPVSVDIPVDISNAHLDKYVYPDTVDLPGYKPTLKGNPRQIEKLAEAIANAKRPMLYAGGGIISSGASTELLKVMEKGNLPTVITLMGLGTVPHGHPLFLGMPGMHGTVAANYAIMQCDLLIGVGVRFDDRVTGNLQTFAKHAKIAHIDVDPAEISKNVNAHIPIVGDAKTVLSELLDVMKARETDEWNAKVNGWKKEHVLHYNQKMDDEIHPQYVIERASELASDDAIVTTEVGQHQMFTALYYKHKKARSFISSGGLGTMGFGFPAAMGAAVANPDKLVMVVAGDGSLQMNMQELTTCALNNIGVKIILLNNMYLGMVRQWQEFFWNKNYSKTCLKQDSSCPRNCKGPGAHCRKVYLPDFVKLSEACGVPAMRTADPKEVDKILKEGFAVKGPVLMEFMTKQTENVYPMVPAGKSIDEILMGDK
ncbi:MAG: biosynthetic-type acetolactate synthase large subunit [Fibrobacteres bacterium]|nr:biosynthetic-type acetolactate synthase large subunit [Fibrobacterota bacterium]